MYNNYSNSQQHHQYSNPYFQHILPAAAATASAEGAQSSSDDAGQEQLQSHSNSKNNNKINTHSKSNSKSTAGTGSMPSPASGIAHQPTTVKKQSNGKKGNNSQTTGGTAGSSNKASTSSTLLTQQDADNSGNDDDKKKQRSSKACDACRRQKCKCQRTLNEQGQEEGPCQNCKQNNLECTFFVTSKKRGPPKGYIEAIENRMHRMEALLGGLLNNDDPRAQALLEELVGDIEARELLSKDLAAAAAIGQENAPLLKSWQRSTASGTLNLKREDSVGPLSLSGDYGGNQGSTSSLSRGTITQRGFDINDFGGSSSSSRGGLGGSTSLNNSNAFSTSLSNAGVPMMDNIFPNGGDMHKAAWIPDDELLLGGSDTSPSFSAVGGFDGSSMDYEGGSSMHPASVRSVDNAGLVNMNIPAGSGSGGVAGMNMAGSQPGSFASSALAIPASNPFVNLGLGSSNNTSTNPAILDPAASAFASFGTSPRQRRKLDPQLQGGARASSSTGFNNNNNNKAQSPCANSKKDGNQTHNLFSLQQRTGGQVPAPDSILHTGAAYYNLTNNNNNTSPSPASGGMGGPDDRSDADGLSPGAASTAFSTVSAGTASHQQQQQGQQDGPLSELADVVGQLSLDETKEVRYHGRSSGLYLISKSNRYQDFFWRFPKPGAWAHGGNNSHSQRNGTTAQNKIEEEESGILSSLSGGPQDGNIHNDEDDDNDDVDIKTGSQTPETIADPYAKTEAELVNRTKAYEIMPDKRTSDHLLELYWTYVHPHLPLLYRSLFVRQYRNTVHTSEGYATGAKEGNGSSTTTPMGGMKPAPALASGGKVPAILLLSIYALAARYSDTGEDTRKEGEYWKAGEIYARKARELLYEDFGSSRLTTCQALLLLAYREAGVGAMAKSWTYVGMAIRMAQDLGLFRDVDKWFLPVNAFGYEEKQTRKRVWWSCVILDRYISAYIGRPMGIFERDYDVALPAEDEPDEHDIWRPLRPDGTDWSDPPIMNTDGDQVLASIRNYPQGVKSNSLSCFNHSASLSVLFSRIIANLYAIRVRVLGQNSETLLAHLDQALATWWLKLPAHLQYNSASKRVPPPHVLTLHCQFYAALILLHRPFIPAQGSPRTNQTFPSHSICTTAAAAISNIVTLYSKTYGLRQAIPFMVYYIFSAGIMHFYNSTYDESLAPTAKAHLARCMNALKEMQVTWGAAARQRELLIGFVDTADLEQYVDLDTPSAVSDNRGRKREAENQDVESLPGSGRATPSTGRGSAMDIVGHFSSNPSKGPFATASLGQMASATQPPAPRRAASQTNQKGQAGGKRRHNSISAAGLRHAQAPVHPPADMRIHTGNLNSNVNINSGSSLFPQADFTFISPSAPSAPLPSLPLPSPSWGKVGGFEFSNPIPPTTGTSPSSAFFNFTSPPMIPPASEFSSHDNQHISNILGLTSQNDPLNFAQNLGFTQQAPPVQGTSNIVDNQPNNTTNFDMNIVHNNTNNIDDNAFRPDMTFGQTDPSSEPRYGDIAQFLFDPFWQSQMRQMVTNHPDNQHTILTNTAFTGLPDAPIGAGPMFAEAQASDLFAGMTADYNSDDWSHYFSQHTPNQS